MIYVDKRHSEGVATHNTYYATRHYVENPQHRQPRNYYTQPPLSQKGAGQDRLGIYIKSVVKGGAADADGRLQAGDQLLKVDGQSLVGITQEKAAEYLVRTGPVVTLEVAKQGAIYHGLATLLSQPSPVMARASQKAVSLTSLAEEPSCVSPLPLSRPSHNQSCQTLSAEHIENNIPEIRIEMPSVSPSAENLLSVPTTRVKCYKIPPDNDLCLCEDIFQQHQARLVNCDFEDAKAISHSREKQNNKLVGQLSKRKADIVRFHKKDQGTDAMSPKWLNRSLDDIRHVPEDRFAGWIPLPGMRRCRSDFYLTKDGQWRMIDDTENLKDIFSEEVRVYNLNERQTECYKEVLEAVVSSTSTSECGCDNDSVSPKSTDSSSVTSPTLTLKPHFSKVPNVNDSSSSDEEPKAKLTAEEREQTLRELDEIVSGSFLKKLSDFGKGVSANETSRNRMSEFLSDMLKLDLSSLKTSSSSDKSSSKNNSSSDDEMLQFGCGRVAALAKHFSRMGEAGIIRGRGGNFNRGGRGRGLSRNIFRSEPNIANMTKDWLLNPQSDDLIIPAPSEENNHSSPHLQMIFTSFGLHPVGFSMDRLLDIGNQGVVLKEIDDDKTEASNTDQNDNKVEDIILEGNYEDPETEIFVKNPRAKGIRFNSWTQTSDSIDIPNEELNTIGGPCSHKKTLDSFEKKMPNNTLTNFKKMSLSFDSYTNSLPKPKPIDLKKKSISVDEIELRKNKRLGLQKHYSFIDLSSTDCDSNQELLEDDKVGVMSSVGCKRLNGFRERRGKFCSSEEISKQYGMKDDSKDISIRKWLSVDGSEPKDEFVIRAEKLDTGTVKDSLRKIHNQGEGMGRKLKRMKKVDQKMFVISPFRFSEVNSREGIVTILSSDKDECSSLLHSRRNSVPASMLRSEMQESNSPRRMSERDLPSRVLSEQQNLVPRGQLPPHAPQIHSSKSVPSLHSGNHELHGGGTMVGGGGGVANRGHEVFNPGYSRTSSTNSIPQQPPPPNTLRSRSSQNLADHRGSTLPPGGGGNLGARQASNPSLGPNQPPPHPHSAYQQHMHQQHQLMLQQQHQQQQQQQQQQSSPSGENGERFYQNLSVYRNQEIQNGFIPQVSGRGKLPSPQDDRSPAQLQKSFRGSQSSLSTSRPPPDPQQTLSRPASAYLPQQPQNYHPQHMQQGMPPRSQSSRDMLRQEAKLQEMTEEVRRRELRLTSPQNRLQMPQGPIQQHQPQQQQQIGPRPGYPVEPYSNGPMRQAMKQQDAGYRESPPPPPPPTSTHPLYQPPTAARYTASMAEPPRGGYYPAGNNTQPRATYQFQGTNPWEREEREKEMLMRKEAARQWRDQQIAELTGLGSGRNQQQEEQLRALRLEKEFERRAQEDAEEEEEEDTESNERVQGLLRVARLQDEKRQAIQAPSSPAPAPVPTQTRSPQQQVNGIVGRSAIPPTNNYSAGPGVEEKERLRRLKDMKMKQAEMEAEVRLKRRDEELRQQQIINNVNSQTPLSSHPRQQGGAPRPSATPPAHLRLDNLTVNQPALSPVGQYNGYGGQSSPPQPPERGSSFTVMSQTQGRSPNNNTTPAAKRVSFQDASPPSPPTNPAPPLDDIQEDPNNFINEAESMLASPTSPDTPFTGNTPGVIGAQEVYKDPRTRMLQEQQNQKMMTAKVPEKLSFKEKMKMFAMETGEDGTPRDKVKISRAQRDIDNIGSPTTPNNNTSVGNNNN